MGFEIKRKYSFDDVLLLPKKSSLSSRNDVDLSTHVGRLALDVPIISSPMDTVTESNMAIFMGNNGGMGIIHRYMPISKQVEEVSFVVKEGYQVGAAVGINDDSFERALKLADAGVNLLMLDIAHGHTAKALIMIEGLKHSFPAIQICSGNIATGKAAKDCINAGADILRVGIGGGSACTTRIVAGVGNPQLSAILDVSEEISSVWGPSFMSNKIISDGGIRSSADIVKALAAGAGSVMIGGLFAAFDIAAGEQYYKPTDIPLEGFGEGLKQHKRMKNFRGMASAAALSTRKDDFIAEGEGFEVEIDYNYQEKFDNLVEGTKLGLSYLGVKYIQELEGLAEFVEVSPLAFKDNAAHYGN